MSPSEQTSPRIAALRTALGSAADGALDEFWAAVRDGGSPLVEAVADGSTDVLVTFLWRGADAKNVRIINDDVLPSSPAENAMVRLDSTDVWYRTYRLPADLRFEYLLAPNDPALAGEEPISWRDAIATWQPDPLNPKQYLLPDDSRSDAQPKS
jgi:enterochelin esterase family protein